MKIPKIKHTKLPDMEMVSEIPVEVPKQRYTDLRQVMDYTRPLTIFFSGVEYESYLDILYNLGIRNFLMSYEYLKGKGSGQIKKYPDMHLFIDSGAYTYQNDPKYESYTNEQWEQQIKEYLSWVEKHKDSIFAIADLDLQYLPNVGYEKVYEWREKYFEPFMLRTGVPVCFIYHEDGLEYWDYMCKRYPYVGLSLAIDKTENGTEQLKDMFRIAEKHNTLCQGMASTNTSMLTQYPFYTVDSTTWNVGLKYGEISVWTGTKMTRVKKTEFEEKAFPWISKYKQTFDFDLIRQEDKTEMIRVNAYAFVEAEKFVRERLKAKMYWFKAQSKKNDVDKLPPDFFPSPAWLGSSPSYSDVQSYAKKMNINPELPEQELFNIVLDMTSFVNWNNVRFSSLKANYPPEVIKELHDTFVNRIVGSEEEKIQDLISFYRECLSGNNDRLLQLGTNFDRIVKERDHYIEEEEEELVDLTPDEIKSRLAGLIPTPKDEESAPEIDSLDGEIYRKADIIPVFDDSGKFVKGQKAVRKPKKVYSKKYPKFACDTCYAAQKCPEFKAGYVCAYNNMFNRFSTRDMGDIIQAVQGIVEHNMTRMQRAMIMEVINGTIDPVTSQLMDTNIRYMQMLKQMYEYGSPEVLRQTHIIRADGSEEKTTSITNPQGGGILEKLFGGMSNNSAQQKEEIEVEPAEEVGKPNERYKDIEE